MGRPESVDAEDDLLAAMREMLPGMIGMAFMFVTTILIGIGYYRFSIPLNYMHLENQELHKSAISCLN